MTDEELRKLPSFKLFIESLKEKPSDARLRDMSTTDLFLQTLKESFITPSIEHAEGLGDIAGAMTAAGLHPDLEISDILTREEKDAIAGDLVDASTDVALTVLAPAALTKAISKIPAGSILNKRIDGSILKELFKGADEVVVRPTHMEELRAKYGDRPVVSADEIDRAKYEDAVRLQKFVQKHPTRKAVRVIDASDRFKKRTVPESVEPKWKAPGEITHRGYWLKVRSENKRINDALKKYPPGSRGHKEALEVQRQLSDKIKRDFPESRLQSGHKKELEGIETAKTMYNIFKGIREEGLKGDELMRKINQLPEHEKEGAIKSIQDLIARLDNE